jgi:hypothetical protein
LNTDVFPLVSLDWSFQIHGDAWLKKAWEFESQEKSYIANPTVLSQIRNSKFPTDQQYELM